ncbi:cupredoxin domain-containing protein [Undibacterium arcticum]|uniref:Cupredoxin domain-containing protein n=1 Tax=Undibacterium arcticum TaxID=1762892 RepID=A0ABV7F035_9BURK
MKSRILASTLILALSSSMAWSHGDESHEKKTFDPATVEQMDFGKAGDPKKISRTIKFEMTDQMRFTPDRIAVKQGETVKFVVINNGKIMHEMVIGSMKELQEHSELMKKFPEMEHSAPHMAHVKPGNTGEIVWTFNKPGEFNFACLMAGHMEAGMLGTITVAAKKRKTAG